MAHDNGAPDRPRRARVERGPRSKNGCATCLSKKVKCDERRPYCARCVRLDLTCEWPRPKVSLAERRRGLGPIKHRDHRSWSPCSIVTKLQLNQVPLPDESALAAYGIHPSPTKPNDQMPDCMWSEAAQTPSGIPRDAIEHSSSPALSVRNDHERDAGFSTGYGTLGSLSKSAHDEVQGTLSFFQIPAALTAFMPPDLTFVHLAETAPALGSNNQQALSFHHTIFAPLKSTRHWTCSAQSLFVDRAFTKRMPFHFLLALSYSELAIYCGHGCRPPQESKNHSERASQLWLQSQNPFVATDHTSMMLSFLYLFMFWMRRDRLDVTKLEDLSKAVTLYVRAHALDDLCASKDLASLAGPDCASLGSPSDQALLARILIYLYDRDGFCSFFGCGGSFAGHMNAHPEKRRKIWMRSRTAFLLRRAPCICSSTIFAMEDAAALDAYFDLIVLHQQINEHSLSSEEKAEEIAPRLRLRMGAVPQDHSFLPFSAPENDPRLSLMSYVAITYHALQLYFHRSGTAAFGQRPVSSEVQASLHMLVSTAYHTVKAGLVQLLERFQWSLFIGALETHDPVHRHWLVDHISDPSLKDGIQLFQTIKQQSANCITMQHLRSQIGGTKWTELADANR